MTDESPKMGRPPKYKPEFVEQARKLARLGATDVELGDFFGVHRDTIWRWSREHEDFSDALKLGKEAADERVVRSLYAKATGYERDGVKVFQHGGEVIEHKVREWVPPDTTAAIFWLKNRRRDEWRDYKALEHSGPDGQPVEVAHVRRTIVDPKESAE